MTVAPCVSVMTVNVQRLAVPVTLVATVPVVQVAVKPELAARLAIAVRSSRGLSG